MPRASKWLWLALACPALGQPGFTWVDLGGGRLELREHGKPALTYNYGSQLKPGAAEDRRRCCYIFPVYTPAGVSMLDDFPGDHPHHRGLFWAWPVIEIGGRKYDSWMVFSAAERSAMTPVTGVAQDEARLKARNFWQADGRNIVAETLRLTVLPARGATRELRVELTWKALQTPVTLRGSPDRGKSYGGFNARFAPRENTILRAGGEVLGKDEDLVPHRWAELEGVYQGKRAVLRVTPDASDTGTPYQWCLRKYGFVGASFPGKTASRDAYTLEPAKPLTLRFEVTVSDVE
ncbi:MAG: DUF6807 family protein [Bryobacteraceae bacterium]